jgi:type II secretory pathway component PulF
MATDSDRKPEPEHSGRGENETATASDAALPPQPLPAASAAPAAPGGLSLEEFILLNEEIAGMARAGLPLDQGLAVLADEMGRGKLQNVTAQIAVDLKSGLTLPQAVEKHAGRLPAYYAKLLAAGIRSGRVSDVIGTLTVYARTLADLRNTVIAALFYPCMVMVLSLFIFAGLSFFLVPQFEDIFRQLGIKKPFLTEMAFFIFNHALWIFGIVALLMLSALLVRYLVRRGAAGRRAWAKMWYAVPIVGGLLRSARLAAFTDLMGILVDNSIPLPEAFLLAGQSSSDPLIVDGTELVHGRLSQGTPLGVVLREQKLMPEVVVWMVALGEKRGTLGLALHQAAEMYRRQVELRAGLLRTVLPPLLIILIAAFVVILFIIILILPVANMIHFFGGGI